MTPKASHVERMISRSASFFGERLGRVHWHVVSEIQQTEEIAIEANDQIYLSIAEMCLPRLPNADLERDHLIMMMFMPASTDGDAVRSGRLTVITPEMLRSASRETPTNIFINEVVVAPVTPILKSVSVLTYSLRRSEAAARLVASLQDFVQALKNTNDDLAALSLAQAIIDRIEVLEAWGDAEIVLAGTVSRLATGQTGEGGALFLALVDEGVATVGGEHWWVRGSNLQVGETANTAVPVAGGNYLLLRYGARSTQQSLRRYIDELRRSHALKREEFQAGGEGETYLSQVEKDIEKQANALSEEADAWQNKRTPGQRQEELDKAISALRQAIELSPDKSGLSDKLRLLEARRKWIGRFGEAIVENPPMSTLIRVEVSDVLVPKVDDKQDKGKFIYEFIPAMKERIKKEFGVSIPGLRMQGNPDLAPGSFSILIEEVPTFSGQLTAVNHFFCTPAISDGSEAHLPSGGTPDVDPVTGDEGVWLSEDHVNALSQDEVVSYSDAEMLIRHIEAVLRRHLARFLGLQEVQNLLDEWSKDEALSARIDTILPDSMARLGFARLLRTLVREQIPIHAAKDIFSAIEELSLGPEGMASAVRAVRLQLRASLPANVKGLPRIELPLELENSASTWLTRQDGRVTFDIPWAASNELMRAIRELIPSADLPTVVIARDPELRPCLQRMVNSELPFLMVQASEEVLNAEELSEQALGVNRRS